MGAKQSAVETLPSLESIHEDWPWIWGIREAKFLDWKQGLSDDEIQAQSLRQMEMPVRITDNIYLGNVSSVEAVTKLEALGITAVLNMAGPVALKHKTVQAYESLGIRYKRITADDEHDYPLLRNHWEEAHDYIKSSTKNGKDKCVIHCVAGINRSALIVAAYYMLTTQTPVLETVKHIRKQRGNVALSNEGFQQQLVALARLNNLLGPMPGTEESIVKQLPPPPDVYSIFSSPKRERNPLDRLSFASK